MARPKTAAGPRPDKVRQADSLAELRRNGGDKVCAKLPPETFAKLQRIMAATGRNRTDAVIAAIDALADQL